MATRSPLVDTPIVVGRVLVTSMLLAACGRIGFDGVDHDGGDDTGTPLGAVRSLAPGPLVSCAVVDDGSLWCWGDNQYSALGVPTTSRVVAPVRVGTDADWAEVAVGEAHGCARKTDRSLWCWGTNFGGILGNPSSKTEVTPIRVPGPNDWTAIAAGTITCGIRDDRSLWCFGAYFAPSTPADIAPGRRFKRVTASYHICAIDETDRLWCWGDNSSGQLGLGSVGDPVYTPMQTGTATWLEISATTTTTCGLQSDRTLWCWGNGFGLAPTQVSAASWSTATAGNGYACGLQGPQLWCTGLNGWGQLGDGTTTDRPAPIQIDPASELTTVASGGNHTCAVRDGVLACTGLGTHGGLGDGVDRWSPVVATVGAWSAVDVGHSFAIASAADGSLSWWGSRGGGYAPVVSAAVPTSMGFASARAIGAQNFGAVAIRSDGTLWRWGLQYTSSTTIEILHSMAQVDSATTWRSIDGGGTHACGIQTDNSLWCFGYGHGGVLGNGSQTTTGTPIQVGTASYTMVSTGWRATCAIRTDGSAWCWGVNAYGGLGDGTNADRFTPARVAGTGTWLEVAVGHDRGCGRKSDRSLWCWGFNNGTLGDGGFDHTNVPVRIGSDTDWDQVALADSHACAVKAGGALWCWGMNTGNQIDATAIRSYDRPVRVGTASNWASVSVGSQVTCARDTAGLVSCWGLDDRGQLGSGRSWITRFRPVVR